MQRSVRVLNYGRISYDKGLKLQQLIANQHRQSEKNHDTLVLVEHNPVYTIGIRTKDYSHDDIEKLKATGADFFKTNRGGLITFHGPGQLVAYPIINLKNFKTSMRWYVNNIEETIIDLCGQFKLVGSRSPHTGVWIGDNKICAIGVHGSKYVTTHGLAFNCNVDLNWYKHIVPCGIADKGVTSLSREKGTDFSIDQVMPLFLSSFSQLFECSLCYIDDKEMRRSPVENREEFGELSSRWS